MSKPQAYIVEFKYKNNLQLLDTVIYLFSKTVLEAELNAQEISILKYYLAQGYSKDTKQAIEIDLGIKTTCINTNNYKLQKKGFLRPHPTSNRLKIINSELLKLRDCFMNQNTKNIFIVDFKRDEKI